CPHTPLPPLSLLFAPVRPPAHARPLPGRLAAQLLPPPDGLPAVDRDYRVITHEILTCGLYLQGGTEHTHGVSASLLSNVATRVAEIIDSVAVRTSDR